MPQHINKQLLLLIGFILLSFFIPLGFTPLFDLDEGAFSEATREMLINKDYLTTYLNGELRFDKPILIYWLQLMSVKIFGLNEFAFRFPSAVAATLWAATIYIFTKHYFDEKKAFFATLLMISTLQMTIIAKAAIADALLNLFITLSLFLIYHFYKTRHKKTLYLVFVFIGLGALTKGPVAILIPFVVSFLFFSIKKEFLLWLKTVFNPLGLLLFAIIVFPWYITEYMIHKEQFINGFFLKHNIGRFSDAMEGHSGGLYYYVLVLLVGMMPFSYLVIKALSNIRTYIKEDLTLFFLLWFGFVFLFFSFSGTKLPHYIIYGYTPLFVLASVVVSENRSRLFLLIPMVVLLFILFLFPELMTFFQDKIRDKFVVVLIENVNNGFGVMYKVIIGLSLLGCFWLIYKKISFEKSIIVLALLMTIVVNYAVMPAYGKLMQEPVKEAALFAKKNNYEVNMYKNKMPSFNVYYEGLVKKEPPKSGDILFCKVTHLKDFKTYDTLYQKNGFALIRISQ